MPDFSSVYDTVRVDCLQAGDYILDDGETIFITEVFDSGTVINVNGESVNWNEQVYLHFDPDTMVDLVYPND